MSSGFLFLSGFKVKRQQLTHMPVLRWEVPHHGGRGLGLDTSRGTTDLTAKWGSFLR